MAVGGAPLFGGSSSRAPSKALVEFRAGKMTYNTTTKMVTPDKRKGLVSVHQSEGDNLMHFTWKDRTSGNVEDDLLIFPDDCEFVAVPACTTGRVFLLKFKTSSKRMFFWMQEPKTDKDEDYRKKVNEYLNNPPTPGSNRGGSGHGLPSGIDFNSLGDADLQNLLNNMSQQQLMNLFGGTLSGNTATPGALASLLGGMGGPGGRSRQGAGSSSGRPRPNLTSTPSTTSTGSSTSGTTTVSSTASDSTATTQSTPANSSSAVAAVRTAATAAPGTGASNPAIQLSDLQSILSNIQVPPGAEGVGAGAQAGDSSVDLATSLNAEALQPLLSSPGFLDKVKDFLPKEESGKEITADDLKGTVQSPQFQQAVTLFSMALQSGQLAPLVREFGLGEAAISAASKGDMLAFVKALQKDSAGDSKKKDEPEDLPMD